MKMKKFNFISLFPDLIQVYFSDGVISRALKKGLIEYQIVNPRDFTEDLHKTVDDRPFGGGDGMVMLAEPLIHSLNSLGSNRGRVVYLSPSGKPWSHTLARKWAKEIAEPVTLLCGRYAGVDERFLIRYVDEEISMGDFILSGGELPALAMVDSMARFIPGVLGNPISHEEESFSKEGLLECPSYTRPRRVEDLDVPEILLSGNHLEIERFRWQVSLVRTALRRPGLRCRRRSSERLRTIR